MNHDELMSYELTSVPRSLAPHTDCTKLSATKSDLLHILRDKAADVPHPLANTTHIIDDIAVLQSLNPEITYDHLALQIFKLML